jgi:hypothetical protein
METRKYKSEMRHGRKMSKIPKIAAWSFRIFSNYLIGQNLAKPAAAQNEQTKKHHENQQNNIMISEASQFKVALSKDFITIAKLSAWMATEMAAMALCTNS